MLPAETTTVKISDLQSYMEEYHHRNINDRCRADGQKWPCSVYSALYYAIHKKEPMIR